MPNYRKLARQDARKYGLDPNIYGRQIKQESGYNPNAVSPAGARGIAQFMPGTAAGLHINPNNPVQALDAAAKLMAGYVKKYGSYKNALVAYNAGPGEVGGQLPAETQQYVANILGGRTPTAPSARPAKSAKTPTYGSAQPSLGANSRQQIALSLLGMGGLGGYGGGDSLTNSLLAAVQKAHSTPAQSQPTAYGGTPRHVSGALGGSPVAGEKAHSATHETAGLPGYPAFDYMAKAGTPVVAPVSGKIIKLSGHDPKQGPTQGPHGPFGWSVYVQGTDGRTYYLTHLGSRNVKVGQTVKQGNVIGAIGNYAKWGGADHVHMGVHG